MGVNAACGAARAPGDSTAAIAARVGVRPARPANDSLLVNPVLAWTAEAGKAPAGPLAVGQDVVAVVTTEGRLTLLARDTGERLWRRRLGGPGATGPLLSGSVVYAASGDREGRVSAFALGTGRRSWSRVLGPTMDPLAERGPHLYAATRRGEVYALSASTGETLWRRVLPGAVASGIAALERHVVVATEDSLYLLERDTGRSTTVRELSRAVIRPPAVTGDALILTSPDAAVAARDARSLETLWEMETGEPVFGGAVVARDTVFAVTASGSLWRVPLGAPQHATTIDHGAPVRAGPTAAANGVLVATLRGDLVAIGGSVAPTLLVKLRGSIEHPPVLSGGMLFVVDGTGAVYAYRERRAVSRAR